jgi:hypothetical protein
MSLSDGIDDGGLIMIIRMLQAFLGFVEILDEWLRKPLELQRSQIVVQMTMSLMFLYHQGITQSTSFHNTPLNFGADQTTSHHLPVAQPEAP